MKPTTTNLKTAKGETVYNLDPHGDELVAVAGPEGADPATLAADIWNLPEGFRWIDEEEWAQLEEATT